MTYYIAMGIGVAVSLAFVFVRSGGNSVRNLIFKSVSSLFFMLSAVFAVIENYTNAAQYGSLIIMGGALGLVGDILLDLKGVYKKDANNYLKGGFIFFLIGHVFYTAALIHFTKLDWWKVLISAAVAIAVGRSDDRYRQHHAGALWQVSPHCVLLCVLFDHDQCHRYFRRLYYRRKVHDPNGHRRHALYHFGRDSQQHLFRSWV